MKKLNFKMMKSIVTLSLLAVLSIPTQADAASFAGSTKATYSYVSTFEIKPNTSYNSSVNWTYSDQSSHKMWFALYDINNTQLKPALVDYLSYTSFRTDGTMYQNYRLATKREHIINPYTYVSGSWTP